MPRISIAEAEALVARILIDHSVSDANARTVARALVRAEIDGQVGHGLSRVGAYAAQARSGKVDGYAEASLRQPFPASIIVDAAHGFAYPALDLAIDALIDLTPRMGVACAGIKRSHHAGQMGAHVEKLAEAGLVAIMVANTPKAMAPWGGADAFLGTNPIAFAAPRQGRHPLVIDLSLSKVARGKVMAADKAGEPIPEGWALDAAGRPTTDPKAALAGTMLPAGDAKGAALALMVEILAATLIGAAQSSEASSFFDADGPPPGVGQTLIAFWPALAGPGAFAPRIEALLGRMQSQEGVRLPGSGRIARRAEAAALGLQVAEARLRDLYALLTV